MKRRLLAALALTAALAFAAAPAQADDVNVTVTIPGSAGPVTLSDAQLRWGLNGEVGSGAFFGGCNFLSAGIAGDAGSSHVWSNDNPYYASSDGNVTIERPVGSEAGATYREATWDERCLDPAGNRLGSTGFNSSGQQVVIDGGTGEMDPDAGTATVRWDGSFTVVFYGGMTYWWASDPVLTVVDGIGTLTATAGGFGASMENTSTWVALPERQIVLADLGAVDLEAENGFAGLPAYTGVTVSLPAGATEQVRTGEAWGSFPQSFIDFQFRTGQASYWYSSGGLRDRAKPATAVYVSYDAQHPVTVPPPTLVDPPTGLGPGAGTGGGTGLGSGTGGGGGRTPSVVAPTPLAPLVTDPDPPFLQTAAFAPDTLLPSAGLIPDGGYLPGMDPAEQLAWALTGVFALSGAALVGFRKGWLILPWLISR
ncbi:hypothetical protein EXU48_01590 [Occultella glacieicola]|uniref:Htaa domain-containing protein n=1 Tax=Occultella glacieicola TaxID=2518684 RepID=A0ABY2E8T9_9MICO|nr:hypothetical protein [Occultella glacieicola]TDE98913.1 hypothetical protein EXU48_01590 [Occultella glacieicola]